LRGLLTAQSFLSGGVRQNWRIVAQATRQSAFQRPG